jgi:transketolase
MGLSVAAGIGKAARIDELDKRVYCIVGDGEAREGQVAEALDFIVDHGLNNVLPIFNCNEFGQAGRVSGQQSARDARRRSSRRSASRSRRSTGTSPEQIRDAFDRFAEPSPGRTARRWRSSRRPSRAGAARRSRAAAGTASRRRGEALTRALGELDDTRLELTTALGSSDAFTIQPPSEAAPGGASPGEMPSMSEYMRRLDMEAVIHSGRFATRKAYGVALRALGETNPGVVVLDADVSNSTFAETFAKTPRSSRRFVECKIAEQNMISVAAGMSASGKVPFARPSRSSSTRAYDQIEMAMNGGREPQARRLALGHHARGGRAQPDVAARRRLVPLALDDRATTAATRAATSSSPPTRTPRTPSRASWPSTRASATCGPCAPTPSSSTATTRSSTWAGSRPSPRDATSCSAPAATWSRRRTRRSSCSTRRASARPCWTCTRSRSTPTSCSTSSPRTAGTRVVEDNYGGGLGSAIADALVEAGDAFQLEQMYVERIPKSARRPTRCWRCAA